MRDINVNNVNCLTGGVDWRIRPNVGWVVDNFPIVNEEFRGIPIDNFRKYGIEIDEEKIPEYYENQTYGHSTHFLVSIKGKTYQAFVYRHSTINGKPYYYILVETENERLELINPKTNPYNEKTWNEIDAWTYYPAFVNEFPSMVEGD